MFKSRYFFCLLCAGLLLTAPACSDDNEEGEAEVTTGQSETDGREGPIGNQAGEMANEVTISVTGNSVENAQFDKKEIRVPANTDVRLNLINQGSGEDMVLNLVVVETADADEVGPLGQLAGPDSHYLPEDRSNIIAATDKVAQPGETISVNFNTPEPGVYTFFSTTPGHWQTLRGQLIVQ